mmetsp:Transcript_14589/g.61603  ORF Transcript_14589/g.61603 Transcript_14589/m.61603 type:complete len:200 (-) Transcript_14589:7063-7662(-)
MARGRRRGARGRRRAPGRRPPGAENPQSRPAAATPTASATRTDASSAAERPGVTRTRRRGRMTSWRWRAPRWCPCPRVLRPRARGHRRNRGTRGRTPSLARHRRRSVRRRRRRRGAREVTRNFSRRSTRRGRGWRTTRMRSGLSTDFGCWRNRLRKNPRTESGSPSVPGRHGYPRAQRERPNAISRAPTLSPHPSGRTS